MGQCPRSLLVGRRGRRPAQDGLARGEGVDACPEGGATLAAVRELVRAGQIRSTDSVVLFNTGAGWLYR